MTSLAELNQRLNHPHYLLHGVYGFTLLVYRLFQFLQGVTLTASDRNPLVFLVVWSCWKALMASTAEELSSVLILYAKVYSTWSIYSHSGLWWSLLYLGGWFTLSSIVPQPWYRGPSKVVDFTEAAFRAKVYPKKQQKIVEIDPTLTKYWAVMLYANWSITCLNFEAVLAHLSLDYTSDQIKFGKIDVDVYPDIAQEFGVSRDPASFDLPTLILFQHGQEIHRLPELSLQQDQAAKDTITRLGWSKKSSTVIRAFQLETISGKSKTS